MSKVVIVRFYPKSSESDDIAEEIEELLDDGYKPLMQLAGDEYYSVWAFAKEEGIV